MGTLAFGVGMLAGTFMPSSMSRHAALDMIIFGVDMYMGICTHDSQLAKWGYQEPIPGRYLAGMRTHVRCGIMGLSIIRGLHQC